MWISEEKKVHQNSSFPKAENRGIGVSNDFVDELGLVMSRMLGSGNDYGRERLWLRGRVGIFLLMLMLMLYSPGNDEAEMKY